jgi:hypothetical protein
MFMLPYLFGSDAVTIAVDAVSKFVTNFVKPGFPSFRYVVSYTFAYYNVDMA